MSYNNNISHNKGIRITDFGAKSDGVFDNYSIITNTINYAYNNNINKIIFPTSELFYHVSQPIEFYYDGGNFKEMIIEGYGAEIDNSIIVNKFNLSIRGLTIKNAPQDGFVFLRGQGSHHSDLVADNCGRHGFYFGSDSGAYGINSQVTRSTFVTLISKDNIGDGFHVEGSATSNRSWLNDNSFLTCQAINNGGGGFIQIHGSGPSGQSRCNYNTFVQFGSEGNTGISVETSNISFRGNTFVGGHLVSTDTLGVCVRILSPFNFAFGGRWVGEIEWAGSNIFVNTNIGGEGGIFGYIKDVDDIKTKSLHIEGDPLISGPELISATDFVSKNPVILVADPTDGYKIKAITKTEFDLIS